MTYVNTYADVKAESDICCTSSNAVAVVESLKTDTVIFLPDEYLAKNVANRDRQAHRFPDTRSRNPGPQTPPHFQKAGEAGGPGLPDDRLARALRGAREIHRGGYPGRARSSSRMWSCCAHPECSPEVVAASDFSGSTNAMIRYVQQTKAQRYLVLTECAMGDNIAAANPEKDMLRLCMVRCPHMNTITMEETRDALKFNRYVIDVPEEVRVKAYRAVQRMIEIG